ncbi:MAG: J domain-containing protein [Henriciella sp.]|nr:J domain-containing protein [Henriciella sp.]
MNYGVPLPLLWLCALGVLIYFPEHDAFVQVICLAFVILYPLWRGIKFISDRELLSQFFMPDEKPLNVDSHEERRERFKAAFEARQRQYEKTVHSRTDERARQKAANPEAAASAEARSMKLSVLGLKQSASRGQIRSAYRKLAKKYHPDVHSAQDAKEQATQKMLKINEAYDWLSANS